MTAQIFLAAFLGCLIVLAAFLSCLIAIEAHTRHAKRRAEEMPRVIECDPSEQETIALMLDADQALKIAALDYGECQTTIVPNEIVGRLYEAAARFSIALPDANKARIREHHAFEVKGRTR